MDGGDLTESERELKESIRKMWDTRFPAEDCLDFNEQEGMKAIVLYRIIRQCMVEAGWIKKL